MAIRWRRIESMANDLLRQHSISKAPIPVERIAKSQGIKIFYQSLENDVCGFIYRDPNQTVIGINTHHPAVRQNFTAAHELGHHLLHEQEQLHVDHAFRVRLRDETSSQGTNEAEREANYFAASLLMPREFIEKDLSGETDIDLLDDDFIRVLAKRYGVSAQALMNRLKNLGYLHD
jgi:Zn-dependent peptidase ImmA (M78 family)